MSMRESRFVRMDFVQLEREIEATRNNIYGDLANRLSPDQYQFECGKIAGLELALSLALDIEKRGD